MTSGEGPGLRLPLAAGREVASSAPGFLWCCLRVLVSRLQFLGSQAYCRVLQVAFRGHLSLPAPGSPSGGLSGGQCLPLAFSAPAACPSSGFQLHFSLLPRVEHPEFTPLSTTHPEIIETFTNAHLEITYPLLILMYFPGMNIVLQNWSIQSTQFGILCYLRIISISPCY